MNQGMMHVMPSKLDIKQQIRSILLSIIILLGMK